MTREKRRARTHSTSRVLFCGNAWTMSSAAAAKTTYDTLLKRLLDRDPETWSLVSGFFDRKPVLVFLWTLTLSPRLVATVQRTILTAGGEELAEEAKTMLLAQVLARRAGLEAKEPFDTLVVHHPQGKPFWDLDD